MDVCILLSFEILAAHVAAPVHVPLHMSVKQVLLGVGLLAALLWTLEVGAVFPGEVSPEGGEGEHDGDVAHVARVLGRLLLLLLHTPGTPRPGGAGRWGVGIGIIIVLGVISQGGLGPVFLLWGVTEVFLVLEHLVAVLAIEGVVVLVPLLVSLAVGDGFEDDSAKGTRQKNVEKTWSKMA